MRPRIVIVILAALLGGLLPGAARAADRTPPDEVEPVWIFGRVFSLYVDIPDDPATRPSPDRPDADVFLVAPIDAAHPMDPGVVIGSPPAPAPIIVPVHDTVLDHPRPYPLRADCFGVQVLPGPHAAAGQVLTRPDPNGGATLAWAVVLHGRQVPLTSGAVIRWAAGKGLVALDRSWPGYGGTCWTGTSPR